MQVSEHIQADMRALKQVLEYIRAHIWTHIQVCEQIQVHILSLFCPGSLPLGPAGAVFISPLGGNTVSYPWSRAIYQYEAKYSGVERQAGKHCQYPRRRKYRNSISEILSQKSAIERWQRKQLFKYQQQIPLFSTREKNYIKSTTRQKNPLNSHSKNHLQTSLEGTFVRCIWWRLMKCTATLSTLHCYLIVFPSSSLTTDTATQCELNLLNVKPDAAEWYK